MLLRSQQLLLSLQSRLLKKEWLLQARQHRSLREVAGNSKTITDEVNGIAETLETQTDAIKQINNGVEQINDVVQTNSSFFTGVRSCKSGDEQ